MSTPAPDPAPVRISRQSARVLVVVLVVLVVLALIVVGVDRRHRGNGGGSARPAHRVTVGLGGRRAAVVRIESGADRITVSAVELPGEPAEVSTPAGAGDHPLVQASGDRVTVSTGGDPGAGNGLGAELDVRISRDVRWDVGVLKGANQVELALGSGRVGSVELSGGADHADVTLSGPSAAAAGTVSLDRVPAG